MPDHALRTVSAKLVNGGRLIIPAEIRRRLQLEEGDTLLLEVVGEELRIRSRMAAIREVQERLKPYRPGPGEPLVSEQLIAERRAEAERE